MLTLMLTIAPLAWAEKPTPDAVYLNRIPNMVMDVAYTEVCFGGGSSRFDLNTAGASTVGGNCSPGDIGWVMEQAASPPATWAAARAECMARDLRLLEPFEWEFAHQSASALGLADLAALTNFGCPLGPTSDCEWIGSEYIIDPASRRVHHWHGGGFGMTLYWSTTFNTDAYAFRCGR